MQAKQKIINFFKKTFKILCLIILSIVVLFEAYYYTNLGEYRSLTSGEIEISQEVYGDSINYSQVKIYCRKFVPDPIQDDWTAISPNGNIFFPKEHCSNNFSLDDIQTQGRFIHEMVHVYQYQHMGQSMFRKALKLILRDNLIYKIDVYQYTVDLDKKFSDYNVEQQGDILSDYFLYLNMEKSFSGDEVELYKNIISGL